MLSLQVAVAAMALSGPGETVLLDFYADWCQPCREMMPTVDKLAARGYPVRKVNVESSRALARQFHIQAVPCFVLVVDGEEFDRFEGAASYDHLEQMFVSAGVQPNRAASGAVGASRRSSSRAALARSAGARRETAPARGQRHASVPQDLVDHLVAASVRLRVADPDGRSVGSGTIIDARGGDALVLTCGHIFRDSRGRGAIEIDIEAAGARRTIPGELIRYDLDLDVALVGCRPGCEVAVARVAPKGTAGAVGDPVVTVGCDNGTDPTPIVTRIVAVNKYLGPPNVQVAGQPEQGRSGGGLFNRDGEVIGVCNAADPADNEGLFAAVATVHQELEAANLLELCLEEFPTIDGGVFADNSNSRSADLDSRDARGEIDLVDFAPGGSAAGAASGREALSESEAAVLDELARQEGAEVICIVRSLSDPRAKSEIFVLDRASPAFLEQLTSESRRQPGRNLTGRRQVRETSADTKR